jgi:hypothetical protein
MSVLNLPPYMRQQSVLGGINTPDAQYVMRALLQGAQPVQPPGGGMGGMGGQGGSNYGANLQNAYGQMKEAFGADSAGAGDKMKALMQLLGAL